jgi:glucosamine-6-phosphate deaminase
MNVLQFDSEAAWLAGVVSFWRDRLRTNPALSHCLASGNTPIPVFRAMVKAFERGEVSFKRAAVFALDEFGGLAPADPGRCKNMLERDLVKHVDLPAKSFRFFNPEADDLQTECREFDAAVGNGFDLVLLGIGLNGHLGMNEPGSSIDSPTRRVDLHPSTTSASSRYVAQKALPRWGLTVGMKQFMASKEVWLLATGSAKAEIVGRLINGEISEQIPASLMRRHPNCSLFVDQAAVTELGVNSGRRPVF